MSHVDSFSTKPSPTIQDEKTNPIKQDTKKGKLRFYPYNINWNYGFLPQTWEDPAHKNEGAGGVFGDNDPVDVVEISSTALEMGGVYPVKCVGAYAMIDDGELDWKVIAINTNDPLADKINDVEDVERCVVPWGLFWGCLLFCRILPVILIELIVVGVMVWVRARATTLKCRFLTKLKAECTLQCIKLHLKHMQLHVVCTPAYL